VIIIKYTGDISNPGKQQKDNEQKQSANLRDVTIILDENMESIICSILKEDDELGLDIYKHTDEYMRKLQVISDALITGFDMIQQCFSEERIRQGKESALKRSELKASFKLVPGKTE
jgi:hypothetical protein